MNLFLRMLIVWLKARFKKPKALFDDVTSYFHVWFTDQDVFRHMTNSRYFSLTDVCIIDYMLQTRAWQKLVKRGWLPMVVYEDLVFHRALRFPRPFTVLTRLVGWTENHIVLSHVFQRSDGTVACEGYTIAHFITTKGERISTAEVLEVLQPGLTPPAFPEAAQAALDRATGGYGLGPDKAPSET